MQNNDKLYTSEISGLKVDAAQYLAELMCSRLAAKRKQKLPQKFWSLPEWKLLFKQQKIAAYSLLKIYTPDVIIKAVKRKEVEWIYSLRYPGLNQLCIEEEAKIQKLNEKIEKTAIIPIQENKKVTQIGIPYGNNKSIRNLDE